MLTWDDAGSRLYETGIDRGVLYTPDSTGAYTNGYAWNGLAAVTETPSGAAATPLYADNTKYLNLISAEEFGATLEAYTYPDAFKAYDGLGTPSGAPGITVGQQSRKTFGLSYRTKIGNDVDGDTHGYKLHLVYGAQAAPSQRAYKTVNDKPEGILFNWTLTTTPVSVTGFKNTALLTIDSTVVTSTGLAALEALLYGASGNPQLPSPDAVIATFTSTVTTISTLTAPTYNSTTHVITLPAVTGVSWYVAGTKVTTGSYTLTTGANVLVDARVNAGYTFASSILDTNWQFSY
jgi:hypothetical protein